MLNKKLPWNLFHFRYFYSKCLLFTELSEFNTKSKSMQTTVDQRKTGISIKKNCSVPVISSSYTNEEYISNLANQNIKYGKHLGKKTFSPSFSKFLFKAEGYTTLKQQKLQGMHGLPTSADQHINVWQTDRCNINREVISGWQSTSGGDIKSQK